MKVRKLGRLFFLVVLGTGLIVTPSQAGYFDKMKDKYNQAKDTATHAAKKAAQKAGMIDEEPAPRATPAAPAASDPVVNQAPAIPEKLPGGITNRIRKMYKELDKVEKKLITGIGTPVDRANRAKLDLKRAEKFMEEIEKRYAGQYSPDHPTVVAATKRLNEVQMSWAEAMGEATRDAAVAAQAAEEKQRAEKAAQAEAAKQHAQQVAEADAAKQASEAACEEWVARFKEYEQGEKDILAYPTEDMTLVAKWRKNVAEAERTLAAYPRGLCVHADSNARYIENKVAAFKEMDEITRAQQAEAKANLGGFIFSGKPFKGLESGDIKSSFNAGENIYGVIKTTKSWSAIYDGKKKDFRVRIDVKIDGKKKHAQFITIKSEEYAKRDYLSFNVAPSPANLVAYSDPNISWGKSDATTKQGPNELTFHLGQLSPGSHKIEFGCYYYGKTFAEGSFTVAGNDFGKYAELHEKIAKGVVAGRTLPSAKMQNKKLEKQMIALLKDAGWDNVYRLNIVDKDWWIERIDGGNTPVKARYMAAVALTKKSDGTYYYKKCTFHQDKLISGAFGELYVSHQGDAVPIDKGNIDK